MIKASDYANIHLAAAAADAAGDALELTGGVVYPISTELRLGSGTGHRRIIHGNGAVIRATQAMRSVLAVINNVAVVCDLNIEANRYADYGVYTETSSTSVYDNVDCFQPLIDGFHIDHDNDRSIFRNCSARICGRIWHTAGFAGNATAQLKTQVTGTCARSGSVYGSVLDFSNLSVDLTTLGLRAGDWVSMHGSAPGNTAADWAQIASVDSASRLTLKGHPFMLNDLGLQFSIHRGDGFHFGPGREDNNIHRLDTCLAENLAGAGFRLGGLYGARATNLHVNAAGAYPVVVGSNDLPALGTFIHGLYTEVGLNGAGDHCHLGGGGGITLDTVNGGGSPVYGSSPAFAYGTMMNNQNLTDPGRVDALGSVTRNYIPTEVVPADITEVFKAKAGVAYIRRGDQETTVQASSCRPGSTVFISPQAHVNGSWNYQARQGHFTIRTSRRVTADTPFGWLVLE